MNTQIDIDKRLAYPGIAGIAFINHVSGIRWMSHRGGSRWDFFGWLDDEHPDRFMLHGYTMINSSGNPGEHQCGANAITLERDETNVLDDYSWWRIRFGSRRTIFLTNMEVSV